MIDIQERLNEALRQYRHNTGGDELVPGYDLQMIAKLAEDFEAERKTMAAAVQQVAQEMRERKVNHGKSESPTLHAWADRLSLACDDSFKQREAIAGKPRRGLLQLAEACGARLTGKPDGSEAITVVFPVSAWWAFDLATRSGTPVPSPKMEAVERALRSAREFIAEQPVRTTSIGANGQVEGVRMDEGNYRIVRLLDKIDCALDKLTEADQNDNSTR